MKVKLNNCFKFLRSQSQDKKFKVSLYVKGLVLTSLFSFGLCIQYPLNNSAYALDLPTVKTEQTVSLNDNNNRNKSTDRTEDMDLNTPNQVLSNPNMPEQNTLNGPNVSNEGVASNSNALDPNTVAEEVYSIPKDFLDTVDLKDIELFKALYGKNLSTEEVVAIFYKQHLIISQWGTKLPEEVKIDLKKTQQILSRDIINGYLVNLLTSTIDVTLGETQDAYDTGIFMSHDISKPLGVLINNPSQVTVVLTIVNDLSKLDEVNKNIPNLNSVEEVPIKYGLSDRKENGLISTIPWVGDFKIQYPSLTPNVCYPVVQQFLPPDVPNALMCVKDISATTKKPFEIISADLKNALTQARRNEKINSIILELHKQNMQKQNMQIKNTTTPSPAPSLPIALSTKPTLPPTALSNTLSPGLTSVSGDLTNADTSSDMVSSDVPNKEPQKNDLKLISPEQTSTIKNINHKKK